MRRKSHTNPSCAILPTQKLGMYDPALLPVLSFSGLVARPC